MSGNISPLPTCTGMVWKGINVEMVFVVVVVVVVVVVLVPYLHRRGWHRTATDCF